MKKLNIAIIGLLMLTGVSVKAQTQMQQEFEKFLTLFPEYEWENLTALFIKGSETSEFSYDDYRKNVWYVEPQNGPDNVFNHIRNMQTDVYGSKTPPPHIKTKDGEIFSAGGLLTPSYFKEEDLSFSISYFPWAKVKISDDLILLFIAVDVIANENDGYYGYIQMFTFKRSTQQMISGIIVSENDKRTVFEPDKSIYLYEFNAYRDYENYDDEDFVVDPNWGNRYVFKLESDGYLRMTEMQERTIFKRKIIKDPDGYVNVRKEPTTQSEVLYTLNDGKAVYVWMMPDSNWAEIIRIYDEKRGYVHKSRLK